jgi:hypothetical protein
MTKEQLTERLRLLQGGMNGLNDKIQTLNAQLTQALKDRDATSGAMQEAQHWIQELEKTEE